jgi:hypothetical protein
MKKMALSDINALFKDSPIFGINYSSDMGFN